MAGRYEGSVGLVHAYPRNPVSAVSKLLPALGKFLVRGDYEHYPTKNVCLGLGQRTNIATGIPSPVHEWQVVDRVECVIYSLCCAHTGCAQEWGFGRGDVQPLPTRGRWRSLMSRHGPAVTSGHQASGRWLACGVRSQILSTGELDG